MKLNYLKLLMMLLAFCSVNQTLYAGNYKNDTADKVINLFDALNELVDEFALTQTQKNQMLWNLYEYGPKLISGANELMNNRKQFLNKYVENDAVSMTWIETYAEEQSQLIRKLIIDKEIFKQEILAILDAQQKDIINDLLEQLLLYKLNLL